MKYKKQIKKFLQDNYTMICSLMCEEERKTFRNNDPVQIILNEINRQIETVSYCQYGDKRMKPTDIWTNHPNLKFKLMCHNGDPCHIAAPRGAKIGTQGLKGIERSRIPPELCRYIVDILEEGLNAN